MSQLHQQDSGDQNSGNKYCGGAGLEQLSLDLKQTVPGISSEFSLGDLVVHCSVDQIFDLLSTLKGNPFSFEMFLSVTAVDWMDEKDQRFEVVYHLLSLKNKQRIRIKVAVSENDCTLPSAASLWGGADFMERECWDMYGINFSGHPNLKRILMYDEFKGHPLRKDYPVQGKQPRIQLRSPEVKNTAVNMNRPELVKINRRGDRS
jgi:NADH-quinone oxidoreductase subunit C